MSSALTLIGTVVALLGGELELLELPQQALLALAHLRHKRLRGERVEREAEPRGLLAHPAGKLPRLDRRLGHDLALGAPSPPRATPPAPSLRPSSRAKNAIVVSGGIAAIAGSMCSATSASLKRSAPSTTITRLPIANVIVESTSATASGVPASPDEDLHAAGVTV